MRCTRRKIMLRGRPTKVLEIEINVLYDSDDGTIKMILLYAWDGKIKKKKKKAVENRGEKK